MKTYTTSIKFKDYSGINPDLCRLTFTGSNITLYRVNLAHSDQLVNIDTANNNTAIASLYIHIPNNTDYDFTLYDCCLYEGAFCNPPIRKSLDVTPPYDKIMYKTEFYHDDIITDSTSISKKGYHAFYKWKKAVSSTARSCPGGWFEFYMTKGYNHQQYEAYIITVALIESYTVGVNGFTLVPNVYNVPSETPTFTKFKLVEETDYIYLLGYYNRSDYESYQLWLNDFIGHPYMNPHRLRALYNDFADSTNNTSIGNIEQLYKNIVLNNTLYSGSGTDMTSEIATIEVNHSTI